MKKEDVFRGVRMPEELVIYALQEEGIDINSVSHIAEDHGLFYMECNKPVSALGCIIHLPNDTGKIEYYLKHQDRSLSLAYSMLKAELLLIEGGKREKFYKRIHVVFENGLEPKTVYVFVEVGDLK
jgi:hypothetical protein